jgi:hypothetical protein
MNTIEYANSKFGFALVARNTEKEKAWLPPSIVSKVSSTLHIEDQTILYTLQQRTLNGLLNLEDTAGFSIYRVSLNGPLLI